MNILAIGAHPDDIEIFMYGILALFKNRGDIVNTIIATDGSLGGKVQKEALVSRQQESTLALKELETQFLKIPDGQLGDIIDHKYKLKEKIELLKPDLIITHHWLDYHSDHRNLSKLVHQIAGHYVPIIYCDTMMGVNFNPSHYIDITSVFSLKKSISFHKTQKPERFYNLIELMNSYRAAQCNMSKGSYAEAFIFKNLFLFQVLINTYPIHLI